MKYLTSLILVFTSTSVLADQVTVPNTFVANTPAVAADVNGNFTTLANGINTNDTNIGINTANIGANSAAITALQAIKSYRVEDKNGTDIGALLYSGGHFISTVTNKGYVYHTIYLADGKQTVSPLFYTSPDCSGLPYVPYLGNGHVFEHAGTMWYVDRMATAIDITANSSRNHMTGACDPVASQSYPGSFPALVNDPLITGATKLEGLQPFIIQVR